MKTTPCVGSTEYGVEIIWYIVTAVFTRRFLGYLTYTFPSSSAEIQGSRIRKSFSTLYWLVL